MVEDFRECLKRLLEANGFEAGKHPLYKFAHMTAEVQNGVMYSAQARREAIIKVAEKNFNRTKRTIYNFYECLFDVLREQNLSTSDGFEAYSMYVVHNNALKYFPCYKELPFSKQYELMKKVCKNTRHDEKKLLQGYAMRMYFMLVEYGLDEKIYLKDVSGSQKGAYDSPWRPALGLDPSYREYIRVFTNFKKIYEYDTGKVLERHRPIWSQFKPVENFRGICRTEQSVDLWNLLAQKDPNIGIEDKLDTEGGS